ncbi:MAG TPA: quinone oxidoreductase [Polyangiales bacterium]|nr:quinone oxidoreductase [Polyangiales bacterium]
MKAVRPKQPGGPEELRLEDFPTPVPTGTQLLVRTEAIGVNFIDVYSRSGQYQSPRPIPVGLEGAGVIEAIGEGVTSLKPGERVAWTSTPGSYATHVLVPAERAIPVPDGLDSSLAAAVLLQGLTAHYLAYSTFALSAGHTALVHAGAGGVGLLLTQIAKRKGARVITTVSTPQKAEISKQAGADAVILYDQQDFEAESCQLTAGRGVDVVYDSVGKTTFEKSLRSLRPRGMLVLFGQSSGAVGPLDPQTLAAKGSLFLTRPTLGHYTATREELVSRANDLFGWVKAGELKVRIDRTFPLADAAEAHRALESRATTGKVLLIP